MKNSQFLNNFAIITKNQDFRKINTTTSYKAEYGFTLVRINTNSVENFIESYHYINNVRDSFLNNVYVLCLSFCFHSPHFTQSVPTFL